MDRIDAVLEVLAVRARRVLLRRVMSNVCAFDIGLPFILALVPADALEVRGAPTSALHELGNNAVLEVLTVRARRSFLRGVQAPVLLLAFCLPFVCVLVPVNALEP